MRAVVVTHFVSPYQAELFDRVSEANEIDLEVLYLHRVWHDRQWKPAALKHQSLCLEDEPQRFEEAKNKVAAADLAILNYYAEHPAYELLNVRAAKGSPWCFWGERPGLRKPENLGRAFRQWKLRRLHSSRAPIWGIGQFAVDGYRKEFGAKRSYYNVPYFSNLDRFQVDHKQQQNGNSKRTFLFSGALIHRKGIDLLARAFARLANERSDVRLQILGEGEMREAVEKTLRPVKDRVEFLGFKDWHDLPAAYANADILCVPSRYDGWGMVVPEGLASGLPVIGTDQMGAALEFLETGKNGWLIQANNEDALFLAMREAASTPGANISELAREARLSVSQHTLQHGAERFIRYAQDVVASWS